MLSDQTFVVGIFLGARIFWGVCVLVFPGYLASIIDLVVTHVQMLKRLEAKHLEAVSGKTLPFDGSEIPNNHLT